MTNDSAERTIIGALRAAIRDHGPVTPEWIGSAAKRILGNLANARQPAGKVERLRAIIAAAAPHVVSPERWCYACGRSLIRLAHGEACPIGALEAEAAAIAVAGRS